MRFPQLIRAIDQEGEIAIRDVFLRFEDSGPPDVLGPPGRWPIIQQIIDDSRIMLLFDTWVVKRRGTP